MVCLPVLYDIVKRRFVRVPHREPDLKGMALAVQIGSGVDRWGPSRKTLNLAHMIGLPNRAIGQISRSWSF